MPIKGLTTNYEVQTNRLGRAWKGDKRTSSRAGKDLEDRFRLDLPEPYATTAKAAYRTLQPKQVRVFFPHDETDKVFETWNDAFTVQGLKHRCNGDRIIREVVLKQAYKGGKPYQKRNRVDCDKPCNRKNDETICKECTSTGYLSFVIRELFGIMGFSQVISQTVTGITDVTGVWNQLKTFEHKYGSLRNSPVPSPSTFGFIPFVLSRVPREISRPIYDSNKKAYTGGYTRGTAYPIVITEDPAWLEHWQRVTQRQHILSMVQSGQQHLLMGEDLQVMQEMQAISLPTTADPLSLPESQPRRAALPEFEPVNTEEIADDNRLADEAIAAHEMMLSRESGQRITATNEILGLDREEMLVLWEDIEDYADESDRASQMIESMLIHWSQFIRNPALTEVAAAQLRQRLFEQMPYLADEDLATVFVSESERWLSVNTTSKPAETVDGVSIE